MGVVIKAGDLWRQIVFTFMITVEITNGVSVGVKEKWSKDSVLDVPASINFHSFSDVPLVYFLQTNLFCK